MKFCRLGGWFFSDGKFFGVTQPKIFTCSLVRQRVSWTLSADSKRVSFQIQAVLTRKKTPTLFNPVQLDQVLVIN